MVLSLESIGPLGSCRPKAKADPKDAQKSRSNLRHTLAAMAPRRPGRLLKGKSRGILQAFPTPRLPLRLRSLGFFAFLFAHARPEVPQAFYPHLHLAVCSHFPEKGDAGYHHVPREQGRKVEMKAIFFMTHLRRSLTSSPLSSPKTRRPSGSILLSTQGPVTKESSKAVLHMWLLPESAVESKTQVMPRME